MSSDLIATCLCGKQVVYTTDIESNPVDIVPLKAAGYNVIMGENLVPKEWALSPCEDLDGCCLGKVYSNDSGRFSIETGQKPTDCIQKLGGGKWEAEDIEPTNEVEW